MKKFVFGIATIVLIWGCANAFDKDKLATHLMKALSFDKRTPVTVGERGPSDMKGLDKIPVTIGNTKRDVYVSKKGDKYIFGEMFDLSVDPDEERASKISLANVRAKGSSSAPVTIVEYTDLQCPYCQRAHEGIEQNLYKAYSKDQVRWVFKHFPLQNHKWAEPAAVATECAGEQNEEAFWKISEQFFKHAKDTTFENVRTKAEKYAKDLKLDIKAYQSCLDDVAIRQRVQDDKNEGLSAGVTSTPTLFINGRQLRGFRNFDGLRAVIDEKLGK